MMTVVRTQKTQSIRTLTNMLLTLCEISRISLTCLALHEYTIFCSLSHRPTLIAKSIVFWRVSALLHEKCPRRMGLEPTTVVVLFIAHRANHLRHGGLRRRKNWLGFIALQLNYWHCVIVCVGFGWLVGQP